MPVPTTPLVHSLRVAGIIEGSWFHPHIGFSFNDGLVPEVKCACICSYIDLFGGCITIVCDLFVDLIVDDSAFNCLEVASCVMGLVDRSIVVVDILDSGERGDYSSVLDCSATNLKIDVGVGTEPSHVVWSVFDIHPVSVLEVLINGLDLLVVHPLKSVCCSEDGHKERGDSHLFNIIIILNLNLRNE